MPFDPSNPHEWWRVLGDLSLSSWLLQTVYSIYKREVIRRNHEAIKDGFMCCIICGSGIWWSTKIFPIIPQLVSNIHNGKLGDLTGLPLPLQILGLCFIFGIALLLSGVGVGMTYFSGKNMVCIIQKIVKTSKQSKL